MSAGQTTPMLSPDGQVGDVPQEKVPDAVKAGFTVGQDMLAPNGKSGVIPLDKVHDAIRSGFQLKGAPPKGPQTDMQESGIGTAMQNTPSNADPENAANIPEQQIQKMTPEDQASTRKAQLAASAAQPATAALGAAILASHTVEGVKAIGTWASKNPMQAYLHYHVKKEFVPGAKKAIGIVKDSPDVGQ